MTGCMIDNIDVYEDYYLLQAMSRYLDYKSEEADDELGNSVDSTQSNNKKTMSVLYYLHTQSLGLSAVSLPNKIKVKEVSTLF